jgi:hypothetical protein
MPALAERQFSAAAGADAAKIAAARPNALALIFTLPRKAEG